MAEARLNAKINAASGYRESSGKYDKCFRHLIRTENGELVDFSNNNSKRPKVKTLVFNEVKFSAIAYNSIN
jgi:hypothetical protein